MLSPEGGLTHYLTEIRKFPMLRPDQESAYAKRWREEGDREAAYHLVTSHLRLVAKIAMRYRGYGLPIADIISEGNVGLMQAVKRTGARLPACDLRDVVDQGFDTGIHPAFLVAGKNWHQAQKMLFFKLRRTKRKSRRWRMAIFVPSTPG
jgi:RNA polymerase sigma-32 factor